MIDIVGFLEFKIPVQRVSSLESIRNRYGESINFRRYGVGKKKLIILIHGIGGDSKYLVQLALKLADDLEVTVITPDLKFHGEKGFYPEADLTGIQSVVEDLAFLIKAFGEQVSYKSVCVMGHSLGGSVCLKLKEKKLISSEVSIVLLAPFLPKPWSSEGEKCNLWIETLSSGWKVRYPEILKWGNKVEFYNNSFLIDCFPSEEFFKEANWSKNIFWFFSGNDLIVNSKKMISELKNNSVQDDDQINLVEGLTHLGIVTSPNSCQLIAELVWKL